MFVFFAKNTGNISTTS